MNFNLIEQLNTSGLVPASPNTGEVPLEVVPEQKTATITLLSKLVTHVPASVLLMVSALAHGVGMFKYPYYENDEGTYISQAWSLVTQGTLSPYTYWYDHAPFGWALLGAWFKAVGGFFTFGSSVDTGRVFMLVLHVLSTLLVYVITKKLTKGKVVPAVLAGLIFSLSPLAVYFQRRVLLDNMMVFWVLLSLWTLLLPKLKLQTITFSAIFFGLAVLTKETAVFFLPAFVYAVWQFVHKSHKLFGMSLWLILSGLVVSLYPLYALLKTEFFPESWFGSKPHVSLLETLQFQASRGSDYYFWQQGSDFYKNVVEWFDRDPFLMIAGGLAIVLGAFLAYKRTEFRVVLLFVCGMLWFLLRGGIIINFYILPLIPFMAVIIAMVVEQLLVFIQKILYSGPVILGQVVDLSSVALAKGETRGSSIQEMDSRLRGNDRSGFVYGLGFFIFTGLMLASMLKTALPLYTVNETAPMKEAISWIKKNLPSDSVLVVDNAIFVDLREKRTTGDQDFPKAEWFWKVEKDPAVYAKNLGGDWLNADYVILSHEMIRQIADYQITLTKEMLPYTSFVTGWNGGGAFLDLEKHISTNGDWMRVYKVDSREDYVLKSLWRQKATEHIQSYGQIVEDPWNTTALDQGQALLQTIITNDEASFQGLWGWTRDHLQHRPKDMLVSNNWKVGIRGSSVDQYDAELQANQDIALALILAGRKWNNASYTAMGTRMVEDLWNTFAVTAGNRTILAATTKQDLGGNYFVDPAVFAPAAYRVFATVDTVHPWGTLASESYVDIPNLQTGSYTTLTISKAGAIYANSQTVTPVNQLVNNVALDAKWFGSSESKFWLEQHANTISQLAQSGSVEARATLLTSLEATDSEKARSLYNNTLATYFSRKTHTWQQTLTPEEQNSLWMAFAVNAMGEDYSKLAQGNSTKKLVTLRTNNAN